MKAFITGASGFVGRHLTDFLAGRKGVKVYGLQASDCDIRNSKTLLAFVRKIRPDILFHLAAQSSVQLSWKNPEETFQINLIGTLNLLEAARNSGLHPRIQIAGSAEVYGQAPKGRIRETDSLDPINPYAASKAAQELLAGQYHASLDLKIIRTRAFNHIGPGQSENFVASNFAKQVARIEAGKQPPVIRVGCLESIRDFTDVRDIVRAYWLAMEKGVPGEVYNVCSGVGHKIREIVDFYLDQSRVKIKVRKDPLRLRLSEVSQRVGDPGKFMKKTGWKPQISFEASLRDILDDWRKNVNGF